MLNKNAFCKTIYFLDYDLINKYNLLNLSQKPKLDLIKINVSLNTFYNSIVQDKSQSTLLNNINFLKKFSKNPFDLTLITVILISLWSAFCGGYWAVSKIDNIFRNYRQ